MELSLLITVAIASGGTVAAVNRMINSLKDHMDARMDRIEVAIAVSEENRKIIDQRLNRLEDHENKEIEQMRKVMDQIQGWIDVVRQPIAIKPEP